MEDRPGPARRSGGDRPDRLVMVCGTGTEVGKTWVAAAVLRECRRRGGRVAARKPVQSFDPGPGTEVPTDAEVLADASGAEPADVCPPHRSYGAALAPPMAAEALGRAAFTIDDLVGELRWPGDPVDLGLVETAGGVRSPQASDGDAACLVTRLAPDAVVLVADAGLGTINAVRLSMDALSGATERAAVPGAVPVLVVLDRFDERLDVHRRNREWLSRRDRIGLHVVPGDEAVLVDALLGLPVRAVSDDRPRRRRSSPGRRPPPPPG